MTQHDDPTCPTPDDAGFHPAVGPSKANRGGKKTIKSGATEPVAEGPRQTLATYRGPLTICTVSLATDVPPQEQDDANARPIAEIVWGAGGATQKAEVDFHNGCAVRLVADWVRVVGTFQEPIDADTWPNFRGSALIHPGNRSGSDPSFTTIRRTIDPGATLQFGIPNWAKALTLHWTEAAAPFEDALIFEILAGDADATTLSIIPGSALIPTLRAFPLPNGARSVRVTNGTAATIGFLNQFMLGL